MCEVRTPMVVLEWEISQIQTFVQISHIFHKAVTTDLHKFAHKIIKRAGFANFFFSVKETKEEFCKPKGVIPYRYTFVFIPQEI